MKRQSIKQQEFKLAAAVLMGLVSTTMAWAEPVWHCSRTSVQMADASDSFSLAGLIDREVIQVSLRDLHEVYHGAQVRLSGRTLSACVMRDGALTQAAMGSLGVSESSAAALSRQNGIGKRSVFVVSDEQGMERCIAQHHPAIGYLPRTTETEALGPCF